VPFVAKKSFLLIKEVATDAQMKKKSNHLNQILTEVGLSTSYSDKEELMNIIHGMMVSDIYPGSRKTPHHPKPANYKSCNITYTFPVE
jgi:hypothetical protein